MRWPCLLPTCQAIDQCLDVAKCIHPPAVAAQIAGEIGITGDYRHMIVDEHATEPTLVVQSYRPVHINVPRVDELFVEHRAGRGPHTITNPSGDEVQLQHRELTGHIAAQVFAVHIDSARVLNDPSSPMRAASGSVRNQPRPVLHAVRVRIARRT